MGYCHNSKCANKTKGRRYCTTCASKKSRKKNPIKYAFTALKNNAKRRGIEFKLTLQEFTLFCKQHNYMKAKGTGADDMTIDRKEIYLPYELGNIQPLTRRENTLKQHSDYRNKRKRAPPDPALARKPGDPF